MQTQTVDVAIIGAGLSGIGAAVHLQKNCPEKSYAILEARDAIGGTWDLFRYPGIRSDSDMYTLGYSFKPWTGEKSIADGGDICNYIRETADEYGITPHIRFRHKVISADWHSRSAQWVIRVQAGDSEEETEIRARFVICGAGYYNYEHGIDPEFPDRDRFQGQIVHPQFWPEDLDYAGKKVVVIGSGATAVTLIPSMTDKAGHVTMLQRSPTYVMTVPQKDPMVRKLREYLPEKAVYQITRARNVVLGSTVYNLMRRFPEKAAELIINQAQKQLGEDFDIHHFTPRYKPWDQRLCAVPDGDLFKAIRRGKASVVTDHIERFTEKGILLKSGQMLEADIIVTATGLDVQLLGGMTLSLDGQPVDVASKHYYRGAMLEDVPNFAMIFGYTNSSWTLKADLISDYFCRVINYMDRKGYAQATPRDNGFIKSSQPFLVDLTSSYVQRIIDQVPKQGDRSPWRLYQNYLLDYRLFKLGKINDKNLVFSNPVSHGYGYELENTAEAL